MITIIRITLNRSVITVQPVEKHYIYWTLFVYTDTIHGTIFRPVATEAKGANYFGLVAGTLIGFLAVTILVLDKTSIIQSAKFLKNKLSKRSSIKPI